MWAVSAGEPVAITFSAVVDAGITQPALLINPVVIDDGQGNQLQREAVAFVNSIGIYLPIIQDR